MTDPDTDLSQERLPWLRSGFALEGWVGALAAWLVGILLAIIWSPLFWIGFAGAVLVLMATRTVKRSPPRDIDVIVSPVDGVVVSINSAVPPQELKLDGEGWTRLRISSGPTSPVGIYAPMDGAVDHVVTELGDPAAFAATAPDRPGLSAAFVALTSGSRALGLKLATGGLGPRLEISSEPGDGVRVGRQIGLQRLGGWCDVYLPASTTIRAWPGETLIAAETVLAKFTDTSSTAPVSDPVKAEEPSPVEAVSDPNPEPEIATEPEAEAEAKPEPAPAPKKRTPRKRKTSTASKTKAAAKPAAATTTESVSEDPSGDSANGDEGEEDVSEMLARLRAESDDVDDPKSS